jgi:murein DD-endopeptidase MepM/ murein hydrolase activator NlpD
LKRVLDRSSNVSAPSIRSGRPTSSATAAGGTVVVAQGAASSGGYGNYVCLQPRLRTCCAHLAAVYVRRDQDVAAHQILGTCGATGHAFRPHLHFEVEWRRTGRRPIRWEGSLEDSSHRRLTPSAETMPFGGLTRAWLASPPSISPTLATRRR